MGRKALRDVQGIAQEMRPCKKSKKQAAPAVSWWSEEDEQQGGGCDGHEPSSTRLDLLQRCFEFELASFLARPWTRSSTRNPHHFNSLRHCTFLRNYLEVPGMAARIDSVLQALNGDAIAIRDDSVRTGSSFERFPNVNVERLQSYVSIPTPRKGVGNLLRVTLPPFPTGYRHGVGSLELDQNAALKKLNVDRSQAPVVGRRIVQWWEEKVKPFVLKAEKAIGEQEVRRILKVPAIDPAQPHALQMSLSCEGSYCTVTVPSYATVEEVVFWLTGQIEGTYGWSYMDVDCHARQPRCRGGWGATNEEERDGSVMWSVRFCEAMLDDDGGFRGSSSCSSSDADDDNVGGAGGRQGGGKRKKDIDATETASITEFLDSFGEGSSRARRRMRFDDSFNKGSVHVSGAEFTIASALGFLIEQPAPSLASWLEMNSAERRGDTGGPRAQRQLDAVCHSGLRVQFRWSKSDTECVVGVVRRVSLPARPPLFRKS